MVTWDLLALDALAPADVYAVLQLRQRVFVVEQRCPYLDADGADDRALHLLGRADGSPTLAAYARLFVPGARYPDAASIGRIVTHPDVRGTGLGRVLVAEALARVEALAPGADVRIGAQRYLERFYEGFGFERASEDYDEDGIPHVDMVRAARR